MKCEICGKELTSSNKHSLLVDGVSTVLCGKHYSQYVKHGHFLDSDPRGCFDSNEFEVTDEGVWIYTYNRKNQVSGRFLIDEDDLDRVVSRKWRMWKNRYFTGNFKPISISQFILNAPVGSVIDHIDGNPANNKKSNLRITSQNKNLLNRALLSNNTTGIAGVWYDNDRKLWCSEIKIDKKKCYLGRYENKEDATYVRYYAEQKLFEEYRSFRNDAAIKKLIDNCNNKEALENYVNKRLHEKYPDKF